MDYETKIYLEKLIGAVDSPDWWSIGITAVNALIVVGLTIWQLCLNRKQTKIQERQNDMQQQQIKLQEQQNKLQKRQVETQEYEIYRRLYLIVRSANYEIKSFLHNIWNAFWAPTYQIDNQYLQHRWETIENIQTELFQNIIDFELKFSQEFFDRDGYNELLSYMVQVYKHMNNHLINKQITLVDGTHTMHYDSNNGDNSYIGAIITLLPTNEMSDLYYLYLDRFVELKQQKYDMNALEKIAERCKVE